MQCRKRNSNHFILIALLLAIFVVSTCTSAFAAKDKVAVLIDSSLYSQVSTKFDRYIQEVEERFPVDLIIYNTASWESMIPEDIRDFLIDEYETNGINGALLMGMVPYALWEQEFGTNYGISSIYYEDMDGSFLDNDIDGRFDYHNFGPNEGPEIWVCWMRPPASDPDFFLNRLFDKAHDYYTGAFVTNKRAFDAGHEDYDRNIWDSSLATGPRLVNIYGAGNVDTDGVGSDITYEADVIGNLETVGYEMFDTWQHANSTLQAWDSGYTYSSEIMPLNNGSLMTFLYGCHSADFHLSQGTTSYNINIATAYPFGESIGQAATGTSWSYGTEYKYLFLQAMGDDDAYLGEAWYEMENYVETESFVLTRYAGRNPSTECNGNNMIGNPFLIVKYSATGDSDSDGMPDWWEYRHSKPTVDGCTGLDRWTDDAAADNDGDWITNLQEYNDVTDPTDPDHDDDGLDDGWERLYFGDLTHGPEEDYEPDGLTNIEEQSIGTDPTDPNTDNDAMDDGAEVDTGSDPTIRTLYVCDTRGNDSKDGLLPTLQAGHGPKKTIQAGIDAEPGTYELTVLDGTYTGAGNKDLDFGGKAMRLKSKNGPKNTIIDCEGSGRAFIITSGEDENTIIDGFTITNAYSPDSGGGMYCNDSSPTIKNCVIMNCSTDVNGGGMFIRAATQITLKNCLLMANSAEIGGGVFFGACTGNLTNFTITANTASIEGGGITCGNSSAMTMRNSVLWDNSAPQGHEISLRSPINHSTLTLKYCDSQDGESGAYIYAGCALDLSTGTIDSGPMFAAGPLGDYYLSQTAAGQASDSPCVDTGNSPAADLDLDTMITRTDEVPDSGTVDMGYHYPVEVIIVQITSILTTPSGCEINWTTNPGKSYTVQWSDNMTTWNDVPVGETSTWTDTTTIGEMRLYRVFEQ